MRGGFVLNSGGYGVEGIGRQVSSAIQHADERKRLREDEGVRSQKEGGHGCLERVFERGLTGGILHYCSVNNCQYLETGNRRRGRTDLSSIVIKGATKEAAANPETASEASLNPRFFVFHFLCSFAEGSATFVRAKGFAGASRFILVVGDSTPGV